MKVLHVINSLSLGGAESLLVTLVKSVPEHCEMEICTLYKGGELRASLLHSSIALHDLNLPCKYAMWGVRSLGQLIQQRRYDIVHAHLFPSILFTALVSHQVRGPHYLLTEHGSWNKRRLFYGFRWIDYWIYSRYEKIICVSQAVADSLSNWLPALRDRIIVIPSGVAFVPQDAGPSASTHDLIFVGRLEPVKGLDILLSALAQLRSQGHCPSLLIVGGGRQGGFLKRLAHRLSVSSQVTFLGYRPDVSRFLRSASIFVLPSRTEGLPISLLEAMAMGKAIVAAAVGGVNDVLENGKDALLVPPEDPLALAQAIMSLLDNPQWRQQLGIAAQLKAQSCFSQDRFLRNIMGLYERTLG